MWLAKIIGWTQVVASSEDKEKAKKLAVKAMKKRCKDDLEKWNWEECEKYYVAYTEEIKEGAVLNDF